MLIAVRATYKRLRPTKVLERADGRVGPHISERELLLAALVLPVWATYIGYQYWDVAGVSARPGAVRFFPDWVPYAREVLTWLSWAAASATGLDPAATPLLSRSRSAFAAAMAQSLGETIGNHLIDHYQLPSHPTASSSGPLPPFAIVLVRRAGQCRTTLWPRGTIPA